LAGACLRRRADARHSAELWITLGEHDLKKLISELAYSPEMLNGVSHDKKIDHWALGCIAFEVIFLKEKCRFITF